MQWITLDSLCIERADGYNLIVFLLLCDYYCSVSLPHGAKCWSVVCECDISLSYSLTFFLFSGESTGCLSTLK